MYKKSRYILLFSLTITILYFSPFLYQGLKIDFIGLVKDNSNGLVYSINRTIIFSILSSILNVIGGLFLAFLLYNIKLNSIIGRLLSILLFPVILGTIPVVFIFKTFLFDTEIFNYIIQKGVFYKIILLLIIQFWHYGFLYTYLFWLSLNNIPKQLIEYSKSIKLSKFEFHRDITIPFVKNIFILLFFINFAFSFFEDSKSQLIFRASQGTEMEFINHWLQRFYHLYAQINNSFAIKSLFNNGLFIFIISILLFSIIGLTLSYFFKIISKINFSNKRNQISNSLIKNKIKNSFSIYLSLILIFIITFPVLYISLGKISSISFDSFSIIVLPLLLTFIASFFASFFSVSFSIFSKLVFSKFLNDFNSKSLLYFLFIFFLQLIPPIIIIQLSFYWLNILGYNSSYTIYFIWIIGHSILLFPILASFITTTHFKLKINELHYLKSLKIPIKTIINYSFIKRFKAEYILTFLFAISFIWNDSVFNSVFDEIPSFASYFKMFFTGRATSYSNAYGFLIISILFATISIVFWQYVIKRSLKQKNL